MTTGSSPSSSSPAPAMRRLARNSLSTSHTTPVNVVRMTRMISNHFMLAPRSRNLRFGTPDPGTPGNPSRHSMPVQNDRLGHLRFPGPPFRLLIVHLQNRQEGLLRNLHAAYLLHSLLALFLLLEELLLAADVATVAFRQHVLAHGLDGAAGDDLRADRGLDRDVE